MTPETKRPLLSARTTLALVCAFVLLWLGGAAWFVAWPLSWLSVPVLVCYGYIVFRFLFELTINRNNVPTMATCMAARRKIAQILQEEAARHPDRPLHIVDMGSGRGELARRIAKTVPAAIVTGVEMARFPFWESVAIQRLFGPRNLVFRRQDFWGLDCTAFDAVVAYLGPLSAQRLGEKLFKELRPGSLVLCTNYPLAAPWVPVEEVRLHAPFEETIFIYRK